MNDDEQGGRIVGREGAQQRTQNRDAAGGSANYGDIAVQRTGNRLGSVGFVVRAHKSIAAANAVSPVTTVVGPNRSPVSEVQPPVAEV